MNNTNLPCSLDDTTELRELILENPDLPLLIFCGEEAHSGEYGYEQADTSSPVIKEITLYNHYWISRDDYKEEVYNDLADEKEYEGLSDSEYERIIDGIVERTEFIRAIIIYAG